MTVHVSEEFVKHMRNSSLFVPCGHRVIKGKGDMVTYLAKVSHPAACCCLLLFQPCLSCLPSSAEPNGNKLICANASPAQRIQALHSKAQMFKHVASVLPMQYKHCHGRALACLSSRYLLEDHSFLDHLVWSAEAMHLLWPSCSHLPELVNLHDIFAVSCFVLIPECPQALGLLTERAWQAPDSAILNSW